MEKLFAVTKDLGLSKYFTECPDVRVQLRDLFDRTRQVVQREKEINLEVVLLIGALEQKNPAMNLYLWGGRRELAKKLGLTFDQYLKRAQAGRVLWRHPELIELIRSGRTYVSHVGMLAAKITEANRDIFIKEISGKTERQVRELVASVNKDGSRCEEEATFDLRLTLTKSQLAVLERAREVLSATGRPPSDEEAVVQALEHLLEKRDPIRKAGRARKRAMKKDAEKSVNHAAKHEIAGKLDSSTPIVPHKTRALKHELPKMTSDNPAAKDQAHAVRKPVPAALKHRVMLRDGGSCSFVTASGQRCSSKMGVQIDHMIPVALGGNNNEENLRLLCREHNIIAAHALLGERTMVRYTASAR